jgi:hypothetical protein
VPPDDADLVADDPPPDDEEPQAESTPANAIATSPPDAHRRANV